MDPEREPPEPLDAPDPPDSAPAGPSGEPADGPPAAAETPEVAEPAGRGAPPREPEAGPEADGAADHSAAADSEPVESQPMVEAGEPVAPSGSAAEFEPVAEPGPVTHAEPEIEGAEDTPEPEEAAGDPAKTLSPAVRRLVRQYDLDITGIHGTGPSGRIRVGDVIGMLGERTEPAGGPEASRRDEEIADAEPDARAAAPYRTGPRPTADAAPGRSAAMPTTSIFECDLGRVLAHRKHQRLRGDEILLTSYYLVACTEAINAVPEVCATDAAASLGITFGTTGGDSTTAIVDTTADAALGSLDSRLRELDRKLRGADDTAHGDVALWIHHYGASGSLLAVPTPLAGGHGASLGVGAVRRQVVVRAVDGMEAPRVAALCYLSLSFDLDRVTLDRANRFLGQLVRVLEQWPDAPT